MLPDIWVKFSGCQFLYFDQLAFIFFINNIFSLWRNKPQKAGAFVLYTISTDHNVSGRVWHALTENCGEVLH